MPDPLTDAEKLAYIREAIAEEQRLENHYRESGWDTTRAQASAFVKIRRFFRDNDG